MMTLKLKNMFECTTPRSETPACSLAGSSSAMVFNRLRITLSMVFAGLIVLALCEVL